MTGSEPSERLEADWWTKGSARTELWYAWLEIAVDAEAAALKARRRAKRAASGKGDVARGLEAETKACMTAVVAAAACLEAMSNNLDDYFAGPLAAKGAAARVSEVVNAVFPEVIASGVKDQISSLFDLRNETIHYRANWHSIELHPVLGLPTTRVARVYSAEAAKRGVDVALAVLRAATKPGRSNYWQC